MTTATPNLISIINRIDLPKEVNPFLEKAQAAMVFQQTGCWPVIRGRKQWDKKSSHGDRMLTIKSQQRVAPETMEKARELVMKLLQPLPLPGVKVGSESDWPSWADACAAAAPEADDLANAQEEHAADDKLSEVPAEKEDHAADDELSEVKAEKDHDADDKLSEATDKKQRFAGRAGQHYLK